MELFIIQKNLGFYLATDSRLLVVVLKIEKTRMFYVFMDGNTEFEKKGEKAYLPDQLR